MIPRKVVTSCRARLTRLNVVSFRWVISGGGLDEPSSLLAGPITQNAVLIMH